MAISIIPTTPVFTADMAASELFMTTNVTELPDAEAIRVTGYVRELGSVSLLFSVALFTAVTGLSVSNLADIEPGFPLDSVTGFGLQALTIQPTRTKVSNTGRQGNYWYVSAVNAIPN